MALAERTGGVIVNADSAQVYRDLAILTARPTAADEARAPHRLYGHRDGALAYSAAAWAEDARRAIASVHAVGRLPILVGGTGLYIRTLLDGIAPVPPVDAAIRAEVRAAGGEVNAAALARLDPIAAARLAPGDTQRIARALEVVRSTGRTLGDWQSERSGGIAGIVRGAALVLDPERAWLVERTDRRFATMLDSGARTEVEGLLARRVDPALPVMNAIGVREITAWVEGRASREEALAAGRLATRRYVKRQATWFRGQAPDDWPRQGAPLATAADASALADAFAREAGLL